MYEMSQRCWQNLPILAGMGATGGSLKVNVCLRASGAISVHENIPAGEDICFWACRIKHKNQRWCDINLAIDYSLAKTINYVHLRYAFIKILKGDINNLKRGLYENEFKSIRYCRFVPKIKFLRNTVCHFFYFNIHTQTHTFIRKYINCLCNYFYICYVNLKEKIFTVLVYLLQCFNIYNWGSGLSCS